MHLSHILVLSSLLFAVPSFAADTDLQPNREYTPQDIVKIVIKALKDNNASDEGIATVFRFASPGNKASTGPIDRFRTMIKRGYGDMLNHRYSRVEKMKVEGKTALQPVYLTTKYGKEVGYLFQLGEQTSGKFEGMWMTEAVFPIPVNGQSI